VAPQVVLRWGTERGVYARERQRVAELAIDTQVEVQVGSTVRIRSLRAPEERRTATSVQLNGDDGTEQEVTIVGSDADVGVYRLTARSPLARALLGHRAGDVVEVRLEQVSAQFEVTAVSTPPVVQVVQVRERGDGIVRLGSLVGVREGSLVEWWRIVPTHEADAMRRWISEETPLARALLGRRVGDRVRTEAPGGRWTVTIVGVDSEGVWG
jgi:transcription elongation GreA/GreB family factor